MTIELYYFSLEEIKELSLKILSTDFFSKYFSTRQIVDKIIADKYDISERYLFTQCEYTILQNFIKKQMNHVLRWLKKQQYIKKYSNRFWIILDKEKIKSDERLLDMHKKKSVYVDKK